MLSWGLRLFLFAYHLADTARFELSLAVINQAQRSHEQSALSGLVTIDV